MEDSIRENYLEALNVFNTKSWRATMTMSRVVLDAIVKDIAPEADGVLAERLKKLGDHVDLAAPIHKLADLLRRGGNTGAHFDPNRKPNREAAEGMLELTEYFLSYLYTLPSLVDDLERNLDGLTGSKIDEDPDD